jgi:hypothetical protein
MNYISNDLANKYYMNILAIHRMNTEFYIKVKALENELEGMLALPELSGVNNERQGQKKWLADNREKRKNIVTGFIPKDIVSGLIAIYDYRDKGYHEKVMTYAAYMGNFDAMARAISFFSNTPIPQEIKAVCDGNNTTKDKNDNKNQLPPRRKKAVKDKNDSKDQPPLPVQVDGQTYKIGDRGPAGGIVFYDKKNDSDGWRYLEAAPNDSGKVAWSLEDDVVETETGVGSGKRNTELIIAALNLKGESGMAAQLCKEYTLNGYDDWFLPSKDELDLLYVNLKNNVKGTSHFFRFVMKLQKNKFKWFSNYWYWSSSQYDKNYAWANRGGYGSQGSIYDKNTMYYVRAIRAF